VTPDERTYRFQRLTEMGCVACRKLGYLCWPVEIHHLNLDGKAGQERRGDEFTIPLCAWHHQGNPGSRMTPKASETLFGPSLKLHSKRFRAEFGSDNELLALTNQWLEQQAEKVV